MSIQELLTYWLVIKKRFWLIGLLLITVVGVIIIVSFLSKPVYTATTSFQVTAPLPAEVSIFSEFRTSSSRDELIYTRNNFITVLQSEFVMGQVIEELELDTDVETLLTKIEIEPSEGSDFIKLRVMAEEPDLTATIANTLMEKAANYFGHLSAGSITANKEFIQQQMQTIKTDLDEAREDLLQFQVENKIGSQGSILGSQEALITSLKSSRDEALAKGQEERAASYDALIATRERELQSMVLLNAQYELLEGDLSRVTSTYSYLAGKEEEAKFKENEIMSASFIRVIPAYVPSQPLPRVNLKILLLGGIVSLVLGVMLAFMLEYLERERLMIKQGDVDSPSGITDNRYPPVENKNLVLKNSEL